MRPITCIHLLFQVPQLLTTYCRSVLFPLIVISNCYGARSIGSFVIVVACDICFCSDVNNGTTNPILPTITSNSIIVNHTNMVGPIGSPPGSVGAMLNNGGSLPAHCDINSLNSVTTTMMPFSNGPIGASALCSNTNGSTQSGNGSSPPVVGSGGDGPVLNISGTGGGGSASSGGAGSNSSGSGGAGGSTGGSGSGSGLGHSPPQHLIQFEPPSRPGRGTEGRSISLRANHFEIRMPKGFLHHYDVSITPEKCPRRVNR